MYIIGLTGSLHSQGEYCCWSQLQNSWAIAALLCRSCSQEQTQQRQMIHWRRWFLLILELTPETMEGDCPPCQLPSSSCSPGTTVQCIQKSKLQRSMACPPESCRRRQRSPQGQLGRRHRQRGFPPPCRRHRASTPPKLSLTPSWYGPASDLSHKIITQWLKWWDLGATELC